MTRTTYPPPREDAPLVVFDFDHTLYDGDSGSHLFAWLIRRNPLRVLAALLATPVLGPMVAFLPTRRWGISGYAWIGSFGLHAARDFDRVIDRYVARHREQIAARLLPVALEVFARHRAQGDRVVVATGAPPELARAILSFVALYGGRRWLKANPITTTDPHLNQRGGRLVGEVLTVTKAIEDGRGRARVGDGEWPVHGPDTAEGAKVRVVSADGGVLVVEAA